MNITYLQQPTNSAQCGQYCLAMLTGKSVEEIIEIIGTSKGTTVKQIIQSLNDMQLQNSERLISRRKQPMPTVAICKVRREWNKSGNWHWVLLYDGNIYDPLRGVMTLETFDSEMYNSKRKLSSYIKIDM